ncbi:MAG: pyridoxamine 5'-phosphate oxidase family protein, partial [Acidimicrobiales bacterium]
MAFLDLTGSGIETVAHLRQNGRIVVMFCSFACPPGTPSVIHVQVNRVADACGYGVPTMDYVAERSQPLRWAEQPREA